MKKFFGVVFALLLFTNSALAMNFSEPMKFGAIHFTPLEGTIISGADNNSGAAKGRGVATFGHDVTEIKCFYDYNDLPFFGDEVINFPINVILDTQIDAIFTDGNFIFYLFKNTGYDVESTNFVMLGKQSDGTFIKYFDTATLDEGEGVYLDENYVCSGDTITFYLKYNEKTFGRIIFQWNDGTENFMIKEM